MPPEAPLSDPLESDVDDALDVLAAILLDLCENPLPTELANPWEQGEGWSHHLLMGTAAPGQPAATRRGSQRDWASLRRFALAARKTEQAQVKQAVGGLRQGLTVCVEAFRSSMAADTQTDSGVASTLEKLERAVVVVPAADLKREVVQAVRLIGKSLEERRNRQESQVQTLARQLSAAVGELRAAQREVLVDGLTKLANRRALDLQAPRVMKLRDEFNQTSTMLFIDVDHFKLVNDRYGHPVGDGVLRRIAAMLLRNFPRRGDFVGRYGGEEFVVLLADVPRAAAQKLADRCLASIREMHTEINGHVIQVTVSIGLAQLRVAESFEEWTDRADQALLQAKQAGRDRIIVAG